jgi:hypothetical protein
MGGTKRFKAVMGLPYFIAKSGMIPYGDGSGGKISRNCIWIATMEMESS